jgi:peroxiredoxin Q/BCP
MKRILQVILSITGITLPLFALDVGQPAFNFKLNDDSNKTIQLSDYKGKWVVLYFFPKADTPGCTTQGKEYTKMYDKFTSSNAVVFGISTDDVEALKKFKEKYGFKHTLLSDPKGEVAKSYNVRVMFGLCSRDTILINPDSKVEKIYRGVDPGADPYKVLDYITSKKM